MQAVHLSVKLRRYKVNDVPFSLLLQSLSSPLSGLQLKFPQASVGRSVGRSSKRPTTSERESLKMKATREFSFKSDIFQSLCRRELKRAFGTIRPDKDKLALGRFN